MADRTMMRQGLQARSLERLGVPGVAALGLLVCAAAFYFGSVEPARADAARLESLQARLESNRDSVAKAARGGRPEVQLADFYAQLLPREELDLVAQRIFALGRRFGVDLKQGSYRLAGDEADGRLARYEAVYQAQAPYYLVRLMLRGLLGEMPFIALEEVNLQRQQATNPQTEVTLKISVYVKRSER